MKTFTPSARAALLGMLAIPLAACASNAPLGTTSNGYPTTPYNNRYASNCDDCGTISYVQQLTGQAHGSGLGMVLGAVAGAVVGHQLGDGRGRDVATVGGAVVGGIAGNEVEKRRAGGTNYYRVTVDMDNGSGTRTIDVASMNGLQNGSRVRFVGNNLQSLG